jgi:hypothetical protein
VDTGIVWLVSGKSAKVLTFCDVSIGEIARSDLKVPQLPSLGRFSAPFPQPLGRSFPQVLVAAHDLGSASACFYWEVGDAEDGVEAAAGGTR